MADEDEADGTGQERPSTAADRRVRRAGSASDGVGKGRATAVRDSRPAKVSLPNRLIRFLREVVAELRKVIWPSRNQLVTYTIVGEDESGPGQSTAAGGERLQKRCKLSADSPT